MAKSNFSVSQTFWLATLTGAIALGGGAYQSVRASSTLQPGEGLPSESSISLQFEAPADSAPRTSVGGGIRGSVKFSAPEDATPTTSVGGGIRGNVQFSTPGTAAPRTSVGGGIRGNVQFSNPGSAAPRTSVGGGIRGNVQFSNPGTGAPSTSVGGGIRGNTQFSAPGDAAPQTSVGGGIRGNTQFSAPGDAAPQTSVGGGIRGDVEFGAPGDASPQTSVGGGTRSDSLPELTAVLPTTQQGHTISARPTFFVYLPPTASNQVFFSLQDEQGNAHYQTMLEISGAGGIVSVTLPEDAPPLELGKNYLWFFAPIEPQGILRPDNYGVVGWVKRVEPLTLNQGDAALSPIDRATSYAKAGIWYDTLDILVSAKRLQPQDATLTKEWKELLEQVGLEAISTQPLGEQL